MRLSTNTVGAVLDLYQRDLGGRLSPGEVRAIAEAVFHHLLAWDRTRLIAERDATLSESELLRVYLPLKRLRSGEPLQYILGSTSFHGLTIEVGPAVLTTRPAGPSPGTSSSTSSSAPDKRLRASWMWALVVDASRWRSNGTSPWPRCMALT